MRASAGPDHVPTMEGDTNDNPSYSNIGRLFAIGYLKGLREAVYRQRARLTNSIPYIGNIRRCRRPYVREFYNHSQRPVDC